jgi:hypothetical protein
MTTERGRLPPGPSSGPALGRLALRLAVIVAFAALWPGPLVAGTTAALCLMLAVGCGAAAYVRGESLRARSLNYWHEVAILIAVAGLVLFMR